MSALNRQASQAALAAQAHAMTGITGFGLLGHAHEMALQGSPNKAASISAFVPQAALAARRRLRQAGAFPRRARQQYDVLPTARHLCRRRVHAGARPALDARDIRRSAGGRCAGAGGNVCLGV
ncbi:MAG: hypothetical protein IPM76_27755 [Chloroflexi bacterium]|nr:hypothetical protein [Chloroflexota bacterium]